MALAADLLIRPWLPSDPIPDITRLLHRTYAELAGQNLLFLASHQDDTETLRRLSKAERVFMAVSGNQFIGTISVYKPEPESQIPLYRQPGVWHFGQFGVDPEYKGQGIGRKLYQATEAYCVERHATALALDTAEPAKELIALYGRWGYEIAGYTRFEQVNYPSVVMRKTFNCGCGGTPE